jgi:hypothetical protein
MQVKSFMSQLLHFIIDVGGRETTHADMILLRTQSIEDIQESH